MELDQHFSWAKQSIHNITDDLGNSQAAFVHHSDMCESFDLQTLLVIQAPPGTQLEVPQLESDINEDIIDNGDTDSPRVKRRRYQMHLKSRSGPINVLLVNQDEERNQHYQVLTTGKTEESKDQAAEDNVTAANNTGSKDKKTSVNKIVEESNEDSTSHNTRASTRFASKQSPKKGVSKTNPKDSKSPAKANTSQPDSTPALRQLSPRKAAQQHLFITSTRSQVQKQVNETSKPKAVKERATRGKQAKTDTVEETETETQQESSKVPRVPLAQKQPTDIDDYVTPDVLAPLLRLSPPPNGKTLKTTSF